MKLLCRFVGGILLAISYAFGYLIVYPIAWISYKLTGRGK